MKKMAYLVRHGEHKAGILSDQGIMQVRFAAEAIRGDLAGRGEDATKVAVCSSQEPCAVQSAAIIAAILGVRVKNRPEDSFNPPRGQQQAIAQGQFPGEGSGFARAWRDTRCPYPDAECSCPEGTEHIESFEAVHGRTAQAIRDLLEQGDIANTPSPIIVTHSGVIEACLDNMCQGAGADCHDMAPGEIAAVEFDTEGGPAVRFLQGPNQ